MEPKCDPDSEDRIINSDRQQTVDDPTRIPVAKENLSAAPCPDFSQSPSHISPPDSSPAVDPTFKPASSTPPALPGSNTAPSHSMQSVTRPSTLTTPSSDSSVSPASSQSLPIPSTSQSNPSDSNPAPSLTLAPTSDSAPSHSLQSVPRPSTSKTTPDQVSPAPSHTSFPASSSVPSHTLQSVQRPSTSKTLPVDSNPAPSHTSTPASSSVPSHTLQSVTPPSTSKTLPIDANPVSSHTSAIASKSAPSHTLQSVTTTSTFKTLPVDSNPVSSNTSTLASKSAPSPTLQSEPRPSTSKTLLIESNPASSRRSTIASKSVPSDTLLKSVLKRNASKTSQPFTSMSPSLTSPPSTQLDTQLTTDSKSPEGAENHVRQSPQEPEPVERPGDQSSLPLDIQGSPVTDMSKAISTGKGKSLKLAVRRYLGKDRLFYLVQTFVSVVEAERKAGEDLVKTLQTTRFLEQKLNSPKPTKKRPVKWRRRMSESLADIIEHERQSDESKPPLNTQPLICGANSESKSDLPKAGRSNDVTAEAGKGVTSADGKFETVERKSDASAVTPKVGDTESGITTAVIHETDAIRNQNCDEKSPFQKQRVKAVTISDNEIKTILTPIQYRRDVSNLVLQSVSEHCVSRARKRVPKASEKKKPFPPPGCMKDRAAQTEWSGKEPPHPHDAYTMVGNIVCVDARRLDDSEATLTLRSQRLTREEGRTKKYRKVRRNKTKTYTSFPKLQRIEETVSDDDASMDVMEYDSKAVRGGFVQRLSPCRRTWFTADDSFNTEESPASAGRTMQVVQTRERLGSGRNTTNANAGEGRTKNSLDIVSIYEDNACLRKVDRRSSSAHQPIQTVQQARVDTNRKALVPGRRIKKFNHALLPPKVTVSPRSGVALKPNCTEPLFEDDTGTDRTMEFVTSYRKFRTERHDVRYSRPTDQPLWRSLDVTSTGTFSQDSGDSGTESPGQEEFPGIRSDLYPRDKGRDQCPGQGRKLANHPQILDTTDQQHGADRRLPSQTTWDIVPRPVRVQRVYADLRYRRHEDSSECKPLDFSSRRHPNDSLS